MTHITVGIFSPETLLEGYAQWATVPLKSQKLVQTVLGLELHIEDRYVIHNGESWVRKQLKHQKPRLLDLAK